MHGGKRKGAGAPKKYKEETTSVNFRVPKSLKSKVREIVKKYLNKHLESVTRNQN